MNQKILGETSSGDAISQVFGPEHPGRVRFIGRGPTLSNYFSSFDAAKFQVQNAEIVEIKSQMHNFGEKLDIVASAVQKLIMVNENNENKMFSKQFQAASASTVSNEQVNENGGNIKLASALHCLIESCIVNGNGGIPNESGKILGE